jgi:hypothetical protein
MLIPVQTIYVSASHLLTAGFYLHFLMIVAALNLFARIGKVALQHMAESAKHAGHRAQPTGRAFPALNPPDAGGKAGVLLQFSDAFT